MQAIPVAFVILKSLLRALSGACRRAPQWAWTTKSGSRFFRSPSWFKLLNKRICEMSRLDFTPYRRSTVGFDRLFDLLESQARNNGGDTYPPFNIERIGADNYRITLAVPGFRPQDSNITAQPHLMTIPGRNRAEAGNSAPAPV